MKVVYLGSDTEYWQELQKKYREYFSDIEYEFHHVWSNDFGRFHHVIVDISKIKPDIVLLDYTHKPLKVLTVARNLTRVLFNLKSLVGLWDAQADEHLIHESNTTGVPVNHIKGVEFGEIVAHSLYLLEPKDKYLREFAKADLKNDPLPLQVSHQMRVGFVTPEYIHVEHDLIPSSKVSFQLKSHFNPPIPKNFKMLRQINDNYYYNYLNSSDFAFDFEVKLEEKDDGKKKKASFWEKAEAEQEKEKIEKFFKLYEERNFPKRTKLLIIDKLLRIFNIAPMPLDEYPYSIRVVKGIDEEGEVIKRMKAGIICYSCPEGKEGILGTIMSSIKSVSGYEPFVFVFHSSWTSEQLQQHYSYQRVMATKGNFELEDLINFCESYSKSDGRAKSHSQKISYHNQEKRMYIDKNKPESYVEYEFEVKVEEISETHLKFKCQEVLPLWSTYKLNHPIQLYMTIAKEISRSDEEGEYMAFLHGIGELERAELRKIVNKTIYDVQHKGEPESDL